MSLGPHAAFIWLSYGVVVVAVAGLIGCLVIDGRRHTRRLEDLEARGVRRRSSGRSSGGPTDMSGA